MKSIVLFLVLFFPTVSFAIIAFDQDGKWSTTFDCVEQSQDDGNLNCDGMHWGGKWTISGSNVRTTIEDAANNPAGGGGRGARFWKGSGTRDLNTGVMRVGFPSQQTEFWARWYFKYEQGFTYHDGIDTKELYLRMPAEIGDKNSNTVGFQGLTHLRTVSYSVIPALRRTVNGVMGKGWGSIYENGIADGGWNSIEVYFKMDTNGDTESAYANGITRMWLNGELVLNDDALNWSGGDELYRLGWTGYAFISNQRDPMMDRPYYVDVDDKVIYNQTPPNVDANGYPFIGCLAGDPKCGDPIPVNGVSGSSGSSEVLPTPLLRLVQ